MLYGQNHIAGNVVHSRETVCQRTADHIGNQLVHIRFFSLGCDHHFTVAQDRDFITYFKDLIHLM